MATRTLSKLHSFHTVDTLPWGPYKVAFMIIRHPFFEGALALVILLNFVVVVIEADITAEDATGQNPKAPGWMIVCGWLVLLIFIIELALRIFVERRHFWFDGWNIFDFVIVTVDAMCSVFGLFVGSIVPVSAMRIVRLCKLSRISKVFRVFPELRLLMAGLIGSLRAIFWAMILLFIILLIWATIGVQFIHPLNREVALSGFYEREGCERCPFAYDSVWHALITILSQNVAGDSWSKVSVPLIETYPMTSIYFVGMMFTVSIIVMNLILGVVVNNALASKDELASQLKKEQVLKRVQAQTQLREICEEMDADQSGYLSKDEVIQGYEKIEAFQELMISLDIRQEDLDILWTILDPDKDGKVLFDEFIATSYSMKESDVQYMLAYVKYYVTKIKDTMCKSFQEEQKETRAMLLQEIQKVEEEIYDVTQHIEEEIHEDHGRLAQEMSKVEEEVHLVGKTMQRMSSAGSHGEEMHLNEKVREESSKQSLEISDNAHSTSWQHQSSASTSSAAALEPSDISTRLPTEDRHMPTNIKMPSRPWQDEASAKINGHTPVSRWKERMDGGRGQSISDARWTQLEQFPPLQFPPLQLAAEPQADIDSHKRSSPALSHL